MKRLLVFAGTGFLAWVFASLLFASHPALGFYQSELISPVSTNDEVCEEATLKYERVNIIISCNEYQGGSSVKGTVFLDSLPLIDLSLGTIDASSTNTVDATNSSGPNTEPSPESRDRLQLAWVYSNRLIDDVVTRHGEARWSGKTDVVSYSSDHWLTPGAITVEYDLPPGALVSKVKEVLSFGQLGGEGSYDDSLRDSIAKRLVYEFGQRIDLAAVDKNAKDVSLHAGRIQFVTVVAAIWALLLAAVGVLRRRAMEAGEGVLALVLYLGFFGTLIGMSGGLGILGFADLTDNLSRGVTLGPISNQISLALDTTKYAVVLFLIGSITLVGLRYAFGDSQDS